MSSLRAYPGGQVAIRAVLLLNVPDAMNLLARLLETLHSWNVRVHAAQSQALAVGPTFALVAMAVLFAGRLLMARVELGFLGFGLKLLLLALAGCYLYDQYLKLST